MSQESAYTRVIFKVTPDDLPQHRDQLVAFRDAFEAHFRKLIDDLPVKRWVNRHLLRLLIMGAGNHAQLWFSEDGRHSAEDISRQFCRMVRESASRG